MNFVHGRQLAIDLKNALGITSSNVRSITINADCSSAAMATVQFVLTPEECGMMTTILKTYQLVQIEPVETRHFDV